MHETRQVVVADIVGSDHVDEMFLFQYGWPGIFRCVLFEGLSETFATRFYIVHLWEKVIVSLLSLLGLLGVAI